MSTEAEEAFAEGFAALTGVHGKTWTFGAASFVAVASTLKPDDPRLLGSTDRHVELQVSTIAMPSPRPAAGDDVRLGGQFYRLVRQPDADGATGITAIIVVFAGLVPTIVTAPASQTVQTGDDVTLTVVASGLPSPTIQWKKDSVSIAGATSTSLILSAVGLIDAGSYTVVATNLYGAATSASAVLTVT